MDVLRPSKRRRFLIEAIVDGRPVRRYFKHLASAEAARRAMLGRLWVPSGAGGWTSREVRVAEYLDMQHR